MTPRHFAWLEWGETRKLAAAFAIAKAEMRFVGGAVRDALIARPVTDIDVATPATPEMVVALLQQSNIKAIPTGIDHGTVTAVIEGRHFEITTLRKDVTTDGRHAEVAYTVDWQEDAKRRDFTINALYLSSTGELFDYFGGEKDLHAGLVRFIGDAKARIDEDYLRILRFFRFYARYGKGEPDKEALSACTALAAQMGKLSGERIRQEMLKLLGAPCAAKAVEYMRASHVLPYALGFPVQGTPMISRFEEMERTLGATLPAFVKLSAFVLHADMAPEIAFAALSKRLRLSSREEKTLYALLTYPVEIHPGLDQAEQKHAIRTLGAEGFAQLVLLNWAYGKEPVAPNHPYTQMLALAESWQVPQFPIRGDDLIARGIKPGKDMGKLLKQLEKTWEKSGYKMTRDQLLAKVPT